MSQTIASRRDQLDASEPDHTATNASIRLQALRHVGHPQAGRRILQMQRPLVGKGPSLPSEALRWHAALGRLKLSMVMQDRSIGVQTPTLQGSASAGISAATCAPYHGQQSREVIVLSAAGQLGMAAPIQLTVVTRTMAPGCVCMTISGSTA